MPKTVLIADESVTIRSVAESLLRGESYKVFSAGDGNMALELAHAEMPDLALIGEKLPGTSGKDVCAAMKSDPALAGIPIVFMRTDRPGAGPKGVDAVLTKPFSPQSLLEAVHRFLSGDQHPKPPGPLTDMTQHGLQDELIDQALGLDDIGPAPAEEFNAPTPLSSASADVGSSGEGSVHEMDANRLEEPASIDSLSELSIEDKPSKLTSSASEQASAPATVGETSGVQDLKEALDSAFGGDEDPNASSHDLSEITSSLKTISLGDDSPAESPASSASPGGPPQEGIHLAGDDEEAEPAHDYEWFINEMGNDNAEAAKAAKSSETPPVRIEPLITRDEPISPVRDASDAGRSDTRIPGDVSITGKGLDDPAQASNRGHNEFISEFRKEIARLEGSVTPEEMDDEQTRHAATGSVSLDDTDSSRKSETNDEVRAMGDRLIDRVTQQVARELAAKIDSRVIYSLIEQTLKSDQKRK